jgi:acyl carrier protein phosphodiesterase
MALATAEPLTVELLQSGEDTEWLTAYKEANNMKYILSKYRKIFKMSDRQTMLHKIWNTLYAVYTC